MKKLNQKGITLIALVITIIVLLILAGVSIAMLTGQNGILTQAQSAKKETEKSNLKEQVKSDLIAKQTESENAELTKGDFKEILKKYFDNVPEEIPDDLTGLELISKKEYGGQKIKIEDIYNGTFGKEKQHIKTSESYVGYYADIDGNGTVDGIIYADLAVGGNGIWNNGSCSNYEYSVVTEGLKNYYVSQTGYEGPFGTKDVLAPEGSGQDRFYVMSLEDITSDPPYSYTYYWYYNAYGKLDNTVETNENDFGKGKKNTANVLAKWKSKEWSAQNDRDIWGVIEDEINAGWFVPSKSEWSAFGDYAAKLGVTPNNFSTYGLKPWYWSSSQYDTGKAYRSSFCNEGCVDNHYVNCDSYVRLSTTF